MHLREARTAAVAVMALALVATACVSPDRPGVSLTRLEASLVFGLEPPPEPIAPVSAPTAPVEDATAGGPSIIRIPFRNPAADRIPTFEGPAIRVQECPTAPPTAAARQAAGVDVEGMPQEGLYSWKREGTQTIFVDGQEITSELGGFETRAVRRVTPTPNDQFDSDSFTYQTVQPRLEGGRVRIMTWRVRPGSAAQQNVGGGVPVVNPVRANEPEAGLALTSIQEVDDDGNTVASWSPPSGSGLLYLPLPVSGGEEYRSVSTDPRSGLTIVHDAHVLGRVRIDACGEVVDGWRVEASQSRSDQVGQVEYNYVVAPQLGAVLIAEEVEASAGNAVFHAFLRLGQLDPDPLPEDLE